MNKKILFVLLLLFTAFFLGAETTPDQSILDIVNDVAEEHQKKSDAMTGEQKSMTSAYWDEMTEEMKKDVMLAAIEYDKFVYEHRKKAFDWNHFSTQVILIIVLVLVGCGILLSVVQFFIAFRNSKTRTKEMNTEIELSKDKIVIRSSVIGVIILFLSLLFFYLYLTFSYPVIEVGMVHKVPAKTIKQI